MSNDPLFILAGNGPYENRGCEAIVRGTTKILRKHFNNPSFSCYNYSLPEQEKKKSYIDELDSKVIHNPIYNNPKLFSPEFLIRGFLHFFNPGMKINRPFRDMIPEIPKSEAVLSIGGDNYSLDYGIPKRFTILDDIVKTKNKPLIIWGASVGPFDALPEYKPYIIDHLKEVTAIFSRESSTTEYLKKNGVKTNVYEVADPAFLLDSTKPDNLSEIELEEGSIGINLSPLMAKYVCKGNQDSWEQIAANIVYGISQTTKKSIYLIPHVTSPHSDDYSFMKSVLSRIGKDNKIKLIEPTYNASETKWIISKMSFFAGARTHATIAALSSGIPTLSFAYSIKASGINTDIFGHDKHCLSPENLNHNTVIKKITSMLSIENEIIEQLEDNVPNMEKKAMDAGKYLKQIID